MSRLRVLAAWIGHADFLANAATYGEDEVKRVRNALNARYQKQRRARAPSRPCYSTRSSMRSTS